MTQNTFIHQIYIYRYIQWISVALLLFLPFFSNIFPIPNSYLPNKSHYWFSWLIYSTEIISIMTFYIWRCLLHIQHREKSCAREKNKFICTKKYFSFPVLKKIFIPTLTHTHNKLVEKYSFFLITKNKNWKSIYMQITFFRF